MHIRTCIPYVHVCIYIHVQGTQYLLCTPRNDVIMTLQSKTRYERSFRDAERAVDAFRRADADQNLSRADVEKVGTSRQSVVH